MLEFYYAELLIRESGYIMLHDTWMPSIQHVMSWIETNKSNFITLESEEPIIYLVQKTGGDDRSWDHFNDFALTGKPKNPFSLSNRIRKKIIDFIG